MKRDEFDQIRRAWAQVPEPTQNARLGARRRLKVALSADSKRRNRRVFRPPSLLAAALLIGLLAAVPAFSGIGYDALTNWLTGDPPKQVSGLGVGLGTSLTASDEVSASVAAGGVTLQARPLITSGERVTLSGSVDSARAGEDVKIQAKDCGRDFFRVVSGAVTREGGSWFQYYWLPGPTTTLRAIWNDATSAEVTIRKRAGVYLEKRPAGRIQVRAWVRSAWRKRVFIQRFDPRLGTWRAAKTVVLTESEGGTALATFSVSLPKGTRVRAFFPRSQAGPCYLDGTSNTLTT
jgi:hypothetical protein